MVIVGSRTLWGLTNAHMDKAILMRSCRYFWVWKGEVGPHSDSVEGHEQSNIGHLSMQRRLTVTASDSASVLCERENAINPMVIACGRRIRQLSSEAMSLDRVLKL